MQQGERHPLALQLLFLGKHLGYLLERRLANRGLNRTQTLVLVALARHPGLKALDLCDPARVEPANVTRTVQSLERLGLLERRPHPTDGRASLLFLTAAGERLACELSDEMQRISAELTGGIAPEDRPSLERALATMRRAVRGQLSAVGVQPPEARHQMPEVRHQSGSTAPVREGDEPGI